MNEVEALQPEAVVQTHGGHGAGQMLRQAREREGVSLESLAGALKVPVDKLAALEAEDWGKLRDTVFARALAQAVCRTLHIEAAPVLSLLPKAGAAKLSANPEGLNTPFKDKAMRSLVAGQSESAGGGMWKFLALGLMAMGGGAAFFYFSPNWQKTEPARAPAAAGVSVTVQPNAASAAAANMTTTVIAQPVQPQPPVAMPSQPASVALGTTTSAASLDRAVAAPQTAPAAAPALAPAALSPVGVVVQPVAPALPLAAPGSVSSGAALAAVGAPLTVTEVAAPTLRMRATTPTWVQVRDARQRVVLEQILQAGGVAETSAARPLYVVVGKADATTVEVDGKALDLAAVARNNVARFEVK